MQCTTKVVDGYGRIVSAHKKVVAKRLLVNVPLLHVFVKLLLLLLCFGKELDLVAHNKDIALQQTLGKLLSISLLTIQRHSK